MTSIVNSVTTLRFFFKFVGVYPGNGSGHHAEVEVIGNSMWRSCLAFYAADFLLDLFEAGFNFPSCAIILNDLKPLGSDSIVL